MSLIQFDEKDKEQVNFDSSVQQKHGTKSFTGIVELMPNQDSYLTEFSKAARNIVLSTNDGKLFVYGTKKHLQLGRECTVYMPHCKNINKIRVTYDHKTLVTADEDGTIFVYKVTEGPNNRIGQYSKKVSDLWEDNRLAYGQFDAALLAKAKPLT